jgi:hypothetical protein
MPTAIPIQKPNRIATINGTSVLLDGHGRLNVTSTYGKKAKLFEIFDDGTEILISLNSMGEAVIPLRTNSIYNIRYYNPKPTYTTIEDEGIVEKIKHSSSEGNLLHKRNVLFVYCFKKNSCWISNQ